MTERGLSLLELLVAMAILALSLTLLYQVDAGAVRSAGESIQQQQATLLAQSLLDARDAVPAAGWDEEGEDAGLSWSVHSAALPLPPGVNENTPRLHAVDIRVRWPSRNGVKELALSTLLPEALPLPGEAAR
jgi:general secretion pathway protein I